MAAEATDEIRRINGGGLPLPVNPSIPSGYQSVWADVSPLLELACRDLRDGELIHGENFNLSAAMSALETLSTYHCLKETQRIAKELKATCSNDPDKLKELRSIEQVAEHNVVALNLVCRLGILDPSRRVYFEFGHHPYFASAVVKRSQVFAMDLPQF